MSDFLHRINPFYKFVVFAVVATLLTIIPAFEVNMAVFIICLALLIIGSPPKAWAKGAKFLIPFLGMGFGAFMTGLIWGDPGEYTQFGTVLMANRQTGFNLLGRFFSFAGLGMVIALTTNPTELVIQMHKKGRLPRKFAYGMLAAFNMVPQLKTEYDNARLAFKIRGAKAGPLSPKVFFAMLVNALRWSEALAIAMHSKGFHE